MQIQRIFPSQKRPILIAGPCSAETEEQVLATARSLAEQKIDLFRAGIWKPRTRPGAFEGIGTIGLKWLQKVKEETGLKVTTEVATPRHVVEALDHDIDVLWIGARTTVSPFSVQAIADSLAGEDVPVLIKNPVNADLKLWIGAIERIYEAGIRRIAAVHRGFSKYGETRFRNAPLWQLPLDLKRDFPDLELICDHSHICGRRDLLAETAQRAFDLNYDGLMTEVHPIPDEAWSDAEQQLTPWQYEEMRKVLVVRKVSTDDVQFIHQLEHLRHHIDEVDDEIIRLMGSRMKLAEQIGECKKQNNISIYQPLRWRQIFNRVVEKGKHVDLSEEFVAAMYKAVHQESISHQAMIMNETVEQDSLK
jgi:chorismate mutase